MYFTLLPNSPSKFLYRHSPSRPMGTGMALSIILYISSILAAMASCCVLVKFVSLGATYGLALGLYHLPIVFMMRSSLHGASWAYEYDAVERISKRMMICFFMIES